MCYLSLYPQATGPHAFGLSMDDHLTQKMSRHCDRGDLDFFEHTAFGKDIVECAAQVAVAFGWLAGFGHGWVPRS